MDVQVLYECKRNRSELLAEAVPEALKNVLLVMAAQGVLAPSWTVCPWSSSPHWQDSDRGIF